MTPPELHAATPDDPDHGCCALPEGHEGLCQWICSDCSGTGRCLACNGSGEDGSGLEGTCMECGGSGRCACEDGWQVEDVYA